MQRLTSGVSNSNSIIATVAEADVSWENTLRGYMYLQEIGTWDWVGSRSFGKSSGRSEAKARLVGCISARVAGASGTDV